MPSFLRMPKVQISLLLALFFVLVAPRIGIADSLFLLVLTLGFTIVSDLLFAYLRKRTLFVPYAAIVTGLILTLIIDTGSTWYQILLIAVSSMAVKNFLRISGRHIFNPAASGLVIGFFVFGLQPSWWAPTLYSGGFSNPLSIALFLVILSFFYVSGMRMRRTGSVVSYLLATSLFTWVSSASMSFLVLVSTFLSPGVLFYGLLMLPEPMTSPVKKSRQLLYGTFVSVATYLIVQFVLPVSFISGNFPDPSLVALLLGNLVFFKFR